MGRLQEVHHHDGTGRVIQNAQNPTGMACGPVQSGQITLECSPVFVGSAIEVLTQLPGDRHFRKQVFQAHEFFRAPGVDVCQTGLR